MAQGDLTVFEEFTLEIGDGSHDLDTNTYKCMLITNATVPTAADTPLEISQYTEVNAGGNYTAGGETLTTTWTEAGGTATFDASTNPSWAQNGANPNNAYYALVYNSSTSPARPICYVDLNGGAAVDMTAGDLTITWNASGIFTLAKA